MTSMYSQAVLEHVYPNQSVRFPVKLSNDEWIYPVISSTMPVTDVKLYSSDHVLLKTISLYIPTGFEFSGLFNVSDVLFNSDNKIEVLYTVNNGFTTHIYLLNEDGAILQIITHQFSPIVFNIAGAYKFMSFSIVGDTTRIYSLPGTMVDVPPLSTERELSASPNPCKDIIEISHPINAVRIRIISAEGKEVYRVSTEMALSTRIQTVALPTGTYIYEVTLSDQRKLTGKFIKL